MEEQRAGWGVPPAPRPVPRMPKVPAASAASAELNRRHSMERAEHDRPWRSGTSAGSPRTLAKVGSLNEEGRQQHGEGGGGGGGLLGTLSGLSGFFSSGKRGDVSPSSGAGSLHEHDGRLKAGERPPA